MNSNMENNPYGHASIWDRFKNKFTGNNDFNRNLWLQNTSVQRHVKDMENAGINPALAASGGASSGPSGGWNGNSGDAIGSANELTDFLAGGLMGKKYYKHKKYNSAEKFSKGGDGSLGELGEGTEQIAGDMGKGLGDIAEFAPELLDLLPFLAL